MNCIMGFVKITNFFLDSLITSRNNKLIERPAYNTLYFPLEVYLNRCYLNQKSQIDRKETKIIRLDNILCWGFGGSHVRLEEEDTMMNSLQ